MKPYCGIHKVPKGKKTGTMKECMDIGQIRKYGLQKIDPRTLQSKKLSAATKVDQNVRDRLIKKLVSARGKINRYKGRYETTKDNTKEGKKKKAAYLKLWKAAEKERDVLEDQLKSILPQTQKKVKKATKSVKKSTPKKKKSKCTEISKIYQSLDRNQLIKDNEKILNSFERYYNSLNDKTKKFKKGLESLLDDYVKLKNINDECMKEYMEENKGIMTLDELREFIDEIWDNLFEYRIYNSLKKQLGSKYLTELELIDNYTK